MSSASEEEGGGGIEYEYRRQKSHRWWIMAAPKQEAESLTFKLVTHLTLIGDFSKESHVNLVVIHWWTGTAYSLMSLGIDHFEWVNSKDVVIEQVI